jgi:diguanylate cyclase (GGDEF)-like protein
MNIEFLKFSKYTENSVKEGRPLLANFDILYSKQSNTTLEWRISVKYTGRIVLTAIVFALIAAARAYGTLYYNFPASKIPLIGLVALLISWWLGSQYDKVKFYSEKDILTETHNRRFVIQAFPKLLEQSNRRNEKIILYLMDVDDFKKINDTHGHEAGDKVLQNIARILVANTTKTDVVARWGGDEFLIISPYSNGKSRDVIIHKIKHALNIESKELDLAVSVSIGTSVYPDDAQTLDALLNVADRKMYQTKSQEKILAQN